VGDGVNMYFFKKQSVCQIVFLFELFLDEDYYINIGFCKNDVFSLFWFAVLLM